MLRIMDNWNISKQLDASANSSGNVVMESGVTAALSIHMDNGGYDSAAASLHANSKYHVPAHSVEGSLKSTPRSSRSNSNAPPPAVECGTLVPPSATALHPAAATARITTTVTTSVAAATAGGGGGGAPPGGGSAVEVPVTVTTGIGGTPRVVTRANGNLHIGGGGGGSSSSADNSDSRMHEGNIGSNYF